MLEQPTDSILREINALQFCDKSDLDKRYEELFGKPPRCRKMQILRSEIAYKIQENYYGELDAEHKSKLDETAAALGKDDGWRRKKPKGYLPGTRIVKTWHGKTYEVTVRSDNMFEHDGELFKSLSAVARKITGTRWSGRTFFGLDK